MIARFVVLLVAVICLSCGDDEPVRPTPALHVDGDVQCMPWISDGPTAIEENLVDILTGFGVEGIEELRIIALQGNVEWIWNREFIDAFYVFIYSVRNEIGEELLGVSGITIDFSTCEFTLMENL